MLRYSGTSQRSEFPKGNHESNLHGRVRSRAQDTAQVGGRALDEDVTSISPGGAPRVLDLPVVNAIQGSVPDSKDTVIKLLATALGEDTGAV
jgi:hypothetical protein